MKALLQSHWPIIPPGNDFPALYYRLTAGSPSVRIDLVSASTTFQPTYSDPYNKRDLAETAPPHVAHLARHQRSRLRSRQHHHTPKTVQHGSNLNLWNWLDPSVKVPSSYTFNKVKVVGTLDQQSYVIRNTRQSTFATGGYYIYNVGALVLAIGIS